ncbi:MAG TPA: aminopeptidase N [Casimicrobiaceae bacterium]|nr:aminopeptidase N [Casimicrobiaceae bacterium]
MLPRDTAPRAVRRLEYRPPAFLVDTIDLSLELDPHTTKVQATLAFRRNPQADPRDAGAPLVLDGENQRQVRVLLDGRPIAEDRYALTETSLALLDPPAAGTLTIQSVIDPGANDALEGLYISSGVFCTQCEPEGFRRIAYFPDRPDVLARYTVTLVADRARYPVLLANGNRVEADELPNGRHYAKWHDPFPKPTYLFAVVAGDLDVLRDHFVTMSGRNVTLEIWSTSRNLPRCAHAMASLKNAMRWDEERYGREYDLDRFMIFCADDFNMGAMENKGLNIFNSRLLLADGNTATDDDFQAIEGVVGHEYFHNWTGNRVTCRDWFQLSLKEGLTVFRDQEFSADQGSRAVERIAAVSFLRTRQFPEDAGPMAHPVRPDEYMEINNFYTMTVYEKGAEVIRMQHTLLGPERFRRGMDLYFERHDGQAVTCDDFVQAMQDASLASGGPDLTQFRRWYAQAGTPVVNARGEYDARARTYTLELSQHTPATPGQPHKEPLHIPVAMGLIGADGNDLPLLLEGEAAAARATTRVLSLTQASQAFRFVNVMASASPVPSLLRGFSAPVRLEFAYAEGELEFLAAHDSDAVNRWEACQRIFSTAILDLAQAQASGRARALPESLARLARHLLADRTSDPALVRLALSPPDLAYLAGLIDVIDVDALVAAREFVMRELARTCRDAFEAAYAANQVSAPYAPVQAQIGPRGLANLCLAYLGGINDERARAMAVEQFDRADNMTDGIAALAAINDGESREREALFARFEAKWRDEPLVLDKWFALQAIAHHPSTLSRVRLLLEHPKFDTRNPNRVRSLLASFAMRNWACFHAADGTGYQLIADEVMALDRHNPHLSSMLASAFNQWARFDEPRRGMQRAALERIGELRDMSPDLSEIVARSLQPS